MTHSLPGVSPERVGQMRDNETSETGPRANEIRPLDRCNLALEGSGPMGIMPTADSTATPPPNEYLERMARVDGCPECATNYEAPTAVYDNAPHGWLANYVCESCGHAWTTSWGE